MNASNTARDEKPGEPSKTTPSVVLRTVSRTRGGGSTNLGDRVKKKPTTPISPKKIPSPEKRNAEDTYFDREMCRFYWGQDSIQDEVTGLHQ